MLNMEIKDEKINQILEKFKKYREQLNSNIDNFINTGKEFSNFDIKVLEKIFNKDTKDGDLNDKNNVFLKCKISKEEALNGCTKKVTYKQIDENGEKNKNILDVKIPKGIQKGQSIIYYDQGNYIKELNKRSNIIIEIEIN